MPMTEPTSASEVTAASQAVIGWLWWRIRFAVGDVLSPGAPVGLMTPHVQAGRPPLPRAGSRIASIMSSSRMALRWPSAASRMSPRTCVPAARAARTLTACSQPPLELRHNVARTSPFICCVIARQSSGVQEVRTARPVTLTLCPV